MANLTCFRITNQINMLLIFVAYNSPDDLYKVHPLQIHSLDHFEIYKMKEIKNNCKKKNST